MSAARCIRLVLDNVEYGSQLSTDDLPRLLGTRQEIHSSDRLENFWSLVKRGLKGTYVAVEPFHLFRYLDEQVFRYNNRATKKHFVSDGDRFRMAVSEIGDKRVTYDQLIGRRAEQP